MLTVATVQVGDYVGRGREYVAKFFNGVRRYMPKDVEWRGACVTDDPATLPAGIDAVPSFDGPPSWWHKLSLFRPGTFAPGERVFFADLDTMFVGGLRDIVGYRGTFAILRDVYHPRHMASSVMAWEAGKLDHIWTQWDAAGRLAVRGGDQEWIEFVQGKADYWHDIVPGQFVSFKLDCRPHGRVPDDARVMYFHGEPRPHATGHVWADELWNNGELA